MQNRRVQLKRIMSYSVEPRRSSRARNQVSYRDDVSLKALRRTTLASSLKLKRLPLLVLHEHPQYGQCHEVGVFYADLMLSKVDQDKKINSDMHVSMLIINFSVKGVHSYSTASSDLDSFIVQYTL